MNFYNTIDEQGETLKESERKALRQEDIVFDFFLHYPGAYTPFDIQSQVLPEAPITSVRRAITNLTIQGKLEKTDDMRAGELGKNNHQWRLAGDKPQKQLGLFGGDVEII